MMTTFNYCKSALSNTVILDFVLTPIGVDEWQGIDMCLLEFLSCHKHARRFQNVCCLSNTTIIYIHNKYLTLSQDKQLELFEN